jgi:hypothetical protein
LRERLIPISNENTRGVTGLCLEVHDLCASKLIAGREKDLEFVRYAVQYGDQSATSSKDDSSNAAFPKTA